MIKNDETFVYNNYLDIGETVWDPTESIETRPLTSMGNQRRYLFHDGNKNTTTNSDVEYGSGCFHEDFSPFEFHLSNGMLRLVRGGEEESWGEIRHSPMAEDVQYSLDKVRAGLDAREKTLRICCFPPTGFSLHLHKTGSYGTAIVVRYREMLKDRNWLVVNELKNAQFFRYPWL